MRSTIALIFLVVGYNTVYAQSLQKLNIGEATIFLKGAQLFGSANVALQKGENEVTFSNVAGDVNNQSISVNATNNVVVEAATYENNYLVPEDLSHRAKMLKDSIELVTEEKTVIANKIVSLTEQITILQENRKIGGLNTGTSVAELQKMLDFVNAKMEGLWNARSKQETIQKKIDETLAKLNRQLDEERMKNNRPAGQITLKLFAKEATSSTISVSYIVPNAGWNPVYDVRADGINEPVRLYYKANVFQNCGIKWDNVHLVLSTGNPNEGAQAPNMNPWYLAFYTPNVRMMNNSPQIMMGAAPSEVRSYKKAMVADNAYANESSLNEYVSVDNSGINTSFDIDIPYTIPSDGKKHLVAIKKYDVPATYRYFAVPKLDKDVFLQAMLTNWEDLNLLSGQTNIFYEGTYIGQGYLDMQNVKDTMMVSLGRDKKIVVKRERNKKLRSVKYIGTNVRETFAYTITVRNTRKEAINLIVQDQQPVSNDKDIELEDKDTGNSDYDETTGLMKWELQVKPNEAQEVHFGFTVKYPKGKTVAALPK